MLQCTDLTKELNDQMMLKAQVEQKQKKKADEIAGEFPHTIVTSDVLGTLERCFNAITEMEQERAQTAQRIR